MDKYREVLESLKETLKMVANRDDVIKKSIDLESSSTDFAGYLYHLLEEDLKNEEKEREILVEKSIYKCYH